MSLAPPLAGDDRGVIRLEARRPRHRGARSRRALQAAAVFALCLFALIGSFADSAVARTGLLLIAAPDDIDPSSIDNIAATLIWATVANLAACAGVVMIAYWLLSRPTAQVVALQPRRYKR